jgi:hypothetical protein
MIAFQTLHLYSLNIILKHPIFHIKLLFQGPISQNGRLASSIMPLHDRSLSTYRSFAYRARTQFTFTNSDIVNNWPMAKSTNNMIGWRGGTHE